MRAAPAVHVLVTRFGVWRGAVGAVLVLVWCVVAAWVASHVRAQGEAPGVLLSGVAVGLLVSASWLAAGLTTLRPFGLRWDGQSWSLSTWAVGAPPPSAEGVAGDLRATVDLGGWLLLRFTPERPSSAPQRWLPVQRRGLEPSWHALRCAVHSPRPLPTAVAG